MNVLETVGYGVYLGWVVGGWGGGGGKEGGGGGGACLCGFGLSVMTVSKTVLYCEFLSFWVFVIGGFFFFFFF